MTSGRHRNAPYFDVVILADLTGCSDRHYRIALQIEAFTKQSKTIGLINTRALLRTPAPDVRAALRSGMAVLLGHEPVTAESLIVHAPSEIDGFPGWLAGLSAKSTSLIAYSDGDMSVPSTRRLFPNGGDLVVVPVNAIIERRSGRSRTRIGNTERPAVAAVPPKKVRTSPAPISLGWIITRPVGELARDTIETLQHRLASPGLDLFIVDLTQIGAGLLAGFEHRTVRGFGLNHLVSGLDGLLFFPDQSEKSLPDALVFTAQASGVPVATLPEYAPHYGTDGMIYTDLGDAFDAIAAAADAGPGRTADAPPGIRGSGQETFAPDGLVTADTAGRPILFLASNGVGTGHMTRLLAIARRAKASEIVFVSQVQAIDVVDRFGFTAEYLPSFGYVGGDFDEWDGWLAADLDRLIDLYDASTIVYDGNHLSNGIVRAVASHPDCKLTWIRRGMWGRTISNFMANAHWCDLVLEPFDFAGTADSGMTSGRRGEVQAIDPVLLLDDSELLTREEAARHIGLDPSRPAILIQLGSGSNRDLVALMGKLVKSLSAFPDLQIVAVEWLNSNTPLNLWPGITVIRGYPIAQYLRAFDICISSSGYNSFHELLSFGVATIFIANTHPEVDNQQARSTFAQDRGAAFELAETEIEDLPELVSLLMNPKAREYLAENCSLLRRPNGAEAAAQMIEALSVAKHG